jgi:hypothetical protein
VSSPFVSGSLVLDFIVPPDGAVRRLHALLEANQARVASAEELADIERCFSASRPLRLPGEHRVMGGFDALVVSPHAAGERVALDLTGPVWLLTDAVDRCGARLGKAEFWGWGSPFAIAARGVIEVGALALFEDVQSVCDTDLDPRRAIADRGARFAMLRDAIDPQAITTILRGARWRGDIVTVDALELDGTLVPRRADALIDEIRAACPPW